jgi:hypothetical protein
MTAGEILRMFAQSSKALLSTWGIFHADKIALLKEINLLGTDPTAPNDKY